MIIISFRISLTVVENVEINVIVKGREDELIINGGRGC